MNNVVSVALLQAAPPAQGSMTMNFVIIGAVIAIFYFLIIRPQRKRQKETKAMISSVSKGHKITTIGGIRGTVYSVKEDSVVLKVDENTKIVFTKSAIASVDNGKAASVKNTKEKSVEPSSSGESSKDEAPADTTDEVS